MLKKLRKHLILLYTISASVILAVGLGVALGVLVNQSQQHTKELLKNQMISVISRLQFTYSVNNAWFTQTESGEDMIIYVHQNNMPITSLKGSYDSPTDRFTLINLAKNEALKQKIDISSYPLNLKQSSIFTVHGDHNDAYYTSVAVLPADKENFIGIVLMYQIHKARWLTTSQIAIILLILLGGIFLFYLMGRYVISKSMMPVEENIQKQHEFIAAVSHELKSPLAVTRANITAIHAKEERDQRLVNTIQGECKRMSRLIEDMLLLASSDARTWTVHPEPVEIDTLLIDCFEHFLPICQEKNMPLHLDLPDEPLPIVPADRERLLQAVTVLIDNAVSYSNSMKGIVLKCQLIAKGVRIFVIDHGIGIPDDKKSQVFDRFYCIDRSRTDKSHFGLGLSIAHEIIRLHGGTLELTDTEGGGCTFVIILPVHPA